MGSFNRKIRRRNQFGKTVFPENNKYVERIVHDGDGRTIRLTRTGSEELSSDFEESRERFKAKFGRDQLPSDPLFWDESSDTPEPVDVQKITDNLASLMGEAGLDPAYVYAFRKTGMFLTESNVELFSDEDLQEFQEAVDEYNARNS